MTTRVQNQGKKALLKTAPGKKALKRSERFSLHPARPGTHRYIRHASFNCALSHGAAQMLHVLQTEGNTFHQQERLPLTLLQWSGTERAISSRSTRIYVYSYTHTQTCTHIYIRTRTHIHIHIRIHIHICIQLQHTARSEHHIEMRLAERAAALMCFSPFSCVQESPGWA